MKNYFFILIFISTSLVAMEQKVSVDIAPEALLEELKIAVANRNADKLKHLMKDIWQMNNEEFSTLDQKITMVESRLHRTEWKMNISLACLVGLLLYQSIELCIKYL